MNCTAHDVDDAEASMKIPQTMHLFPAGAHRIEIGIHMLDALRRHWPEYVMEAAGLSIFMISAGVFAALLEYPTSPIRQAIDDPLARRALIGIAMGLTAIAIIFSPWGKRSGAHLNPASP